jgi:hypothetical protein
MAQAAYNAGVSRDTTAIREPGFWEPCGRFEAAVELLQKSLAAASRDRNKPHWDRQNKRLWYKDDVCYEYKRTAPTQFEILDAFEAAGWVEAVGNPFQNDISSGNQLGDTLKALRRRVRHSPIDFERDSGRIKWRFRGTPT